MRKLDLKIYFIFDPTLFASKNAALSHLAALLDAGCGVVQLRSPSLTEAELWAYAEQTRDLTRDRALFLLNNRVDLAEKIGADGVHLGQSDMPLPEARARLGASAVIGLTAKTPQQLQAPSATLADYFGIGPVFPTRTKPDAGKVLGVAALADLVDLATRPVVAIGGIDGTNVAQLRGVGVAGVAMVSGLSGVDFGATCKRILSIF